MLLAFAARGKADVAPMQPLLCRPRRGHRGGGSSLLAETHGGADEGMVAIVPGRFDEHPPQVRVAGLGDAALDPSCAARVLGRNEAHVRHHARRSRKAPGIAELSRDRQGREIVDAAEAAQALDARPQRLEIEQRAEILLDGAEPRDDFVDRAEIRPRGLIERRQRPGLGAEPCVVAFGPRLLRGCEAAPVAEEKLGETVARAQ
jgi:hypothetical protein